MFHHPFARAGSSIPPFIRAHGRYVTFQMAGVAVSGRMFGQILAPKTAVIWGMSANYRNATVEARRVITDSLQFVTWIAA